METKLPSQELNLFNICKGAVPEIFGRELAVVLPNMADPNTDAKTKRKIVLTFEFAPFPDRQGALVSVSAKSSLGQMDASDATGNIYVVKREGKVSAYSRDIRQELLFGREETEDGKSAAANDKVVGIG